MSVPMGFDFGGEALKPDYVVKCSYGNDSIALIQWLREYQDKRGSLGRVVVLYNDTGWAANWWEGRVENGEKFARQCGFVPARTKAGTWKDLLLSHGAWPDRLRRFCTEDLKVIPSINWLSVHDPEGLAEMVCGVRREESFARRGWPEYVEASPKNEGRAEWSPLVHHTIIERDELIRRAGWVPLTHRSRECRCVLANATDIATWSDEDITEIDELERWLGSLYPGKVKFMFHPQSKKGRPEGIRQVQEWAKQLVASRAESGDKPESGCDSGYCTG